MIDALVQRLMTEPTITVSREETAAAVARRMLEADVKSVVVVDDEGRPEGILTSTDYLRMTAEGVDPHETTVAAFLTSDVVTATPDEEVGTVAGRMLSKGISHLPVVDEDGRLTGIVTTTDLTEHLAHAYPDTDLPATEQFTLHPERTEEIERSWFVAYDGGGVPENKCALLAEERADGFYGFWTYGPDTVDYLIDHLTATYVKTEADGGIDDPALTVAGEGNESDGEPSSDHGLPDDWRF